MADAEVSAVYGGRVLVLRSDGSLAALPILPGPARDVASGVFAADYGPSGDVAIIRSAESGTRVLGGGRLEYPIGRVLWEFGELDLLRFVKVAPDGAAVAVVKGPRGNASGDVVLVDRGGRRTTLSARWNEVSGLAWSPNGREVWFTASGRAPGAAGAVGAINSLHAVSMSGAERSVYSTIGDLRLLDVSKTGSVLLAHGRTRVEARGKLAGDAQERDLTFLDGTFAMGVSPDGRLFLFHEGGRTGGSPPQHICTARANPPRSDSVTARASGCRRISAACSPSAGRTASHSLFALMSARQKSCAEAA